MRTPGDSVADSRPTQAILWVDDVNFANLFQMNPVPMWIYSRRGLRFLRVNRAAEESYGWSQAEFRDRTMYDIRPAADRPTIEAVAAGDRSIPWRGGPFRHCDAHGRIRFVEVVTCPILYEGYPAQLATVWNVTDRLRAEHALRDAQRLARIATWQWDPATGAVIPSPELLAMLGFDAAQPPAGDFVLSHVHPDDLAGVTAAFTDSARAGSVFEHEFRFVRPDGALIYLRAAADMTRCRDDQGGGGPAEAGQIVDGYCQDVTERRMTDDALREREKLSAMGQLTGGVAHDFNNLLTVIAANLELALTGMPEGETRAMLTEAAGAAARGAALTHQLLAFARRTPLSPRTVPLEPFLGDFATMVSRLLGEAHRVAVQLVSPGLAVQCDPVQCESALLNLVLNARDAMPDGGTVTLSAAADGDDIVALRVQDTGVGMTPEVKARALEPFFTTKPPGKRTGLGLSTALGFARQSGGDLTVESRRGHGSTMTLLLPRVEVSKTAQSTTETTAPLPAIEVLLVEDDDSVRAVAGSILERFGATVAAVDSAEAALNLLDAGLRFDLLFSDIVLGPGLDGFELGRRVRRADPMIAVLFTSGYNEIAEEVAASPEIADCELLPKPYAIGTLRAAIHRALSRKGATAE